MKVRMLLMFFGFLLDTSLSPCFLLLFHGSDLKIFFSTVMRERAKCIAKCIIELQPDDEGAFVLFSNICGAAVNAYDD